MAPLILASQSGTGPKGKSGAYKVFLYPPPQPSKKLRYVEVYRGRVAPLLSQAPGKKEKPDAYTGLWGGGILIAPTPTRLFRYVEA